MLNTYFAIQTQPCDLSRFGDGYTIILRVSGENPDMDPVKRFISKRFPRSQLREQHHNMLQYQLPSDDLSLSQVFATMEKTKRKFNVEDFSVSQTTLDQVQEELGDLGIKGEESRKGKDS